jgi:hypothetical protein
LKSEEQQLLYGEKQVFASGQKQAILEKWQKCYFWLPSQKNIGGKILQIVLFQSYSRVEQLRCAIAYAAAGILGEDFLRRLVDFCKYMND